MKIKVSDYIIKFLEEKGITQAFTVTGGGAAFLNDALAKSEKISTVFNHHEQACAMAGVGYSKTINKPSLVMVTTGCAGTNTITGLLDAWQDSNKVFFISGNVNTKETTFYHGKGLRKLGTQEANVVQIIKSITKFSTTLLEAEKINDVLELAWNEMNSERPGPVWIDIPLDIQGKEIEISDFSLLSDKKNINYLSDNEPTHKFIEYIKKSKRPIVVAGNGIFLSDSKEEFKHFIEKNNLPFVTTFGAINILPENHNLYVGRIGLKGTRAGNFALQNSDLIISLGSSLNIPVTGFRYETFGREAKKIVIDLDLNEHNKDTIKIDYILKSDLKKFFLDFNQMDVGYECSNEWILKCNHWKNKWNIFDREDINKLNMYSFSKKLSEISTNNNVVADAGSAYYVLAQSLQNNNLILPMAQGEMGFALPASIGIHYASPKKKTICVTGDGSFQFNIQELQTIKHNNIPIKIFVLNNGGYLSIKNTQTKLFNKRYFGINSDSGVSFPDLRKMAYAYDISYLYIDDLNDLEKALPKILSSDSSVICEVICPTDESIYPTSATYKDENEKITSHPLENMAPFLSKEEFENEMIIPILK